MWSYFDDVAVRNSMVKLKFNLDDQFEICGHFLFQTLLDVQCCHQYSCMHAWMDPLPLQFKQYTTKLKACLDSPANWQVANFRYAESNGAG